MTHWTEADLAAYERRRSTWNKSVVVVNEPRDVSLVLPWPPTGNTAVRHVNGIHYLRKEVREYRRTVCGRVAGFTPIPRGRYVLHLWLSPPDRRVRDADNAIKTVLDALVRARFLPDDRIEFMRELHVVADGYRGEVRVLAVPIGVSDVA